MGIDTSVWSLERASKASFAKNKLEREVFDEMMENVLQMD